jgi:hypothetical protein
MRRFTGRVKIVQGLRADVEMETRCVASCEEFPWFYGILIAVILLCSMGIV